MYNELVNLKRIEEKNSDKIDKIKMKTTEIDSFV